MLALPTFRAALAGSLPLADRILSTRRANLLASWPLSDTSGTTVADVSGNGRNGTYTGVDLGQGGIGDGRTVPYFDGVNDYASIYSASLAAAWNGDEHTIGIFFRVTDLAVWSDAATRRMIYIATSSTNRSYLYKNGNVNGVSLTHTANGTSQGVNTTIATDLTGWHSLIMTVSKAADEMRAYVDGVQDGVTQTGVVSWVGALNSAQCYIGATTNAPLAPWAGLLGHAAVWNVALSSTEVAYVGRR